MSWLIKQIGTSAIKLMLHAQRKTTDSAAQQKLNSNKV